MNEPKTGGPGGCDLFTIGHSNTPIARFEQLLQENAVTAVVDVRTTPSSGRYPWFSQAPLRNRLAKTGIDYVFEGAALGGRPRDRKLIRDGVADYEAMAATPQFRAGIDRVVEKMNEARVCLMCAEREPLDCHRCLLVGRALAEGGLRVGHILADGNVEPHRATEERLLSMTAEPDLFTTDMAAWLAAAYRKRARAVAFRPE
jgi:uncharacterized protein (DUF488 family)